MRHGFVIELKYVGRGAAATRVSALAAQAEQQLRAYLADRRLATLYPHAKFKGVALVLCGWELAHGSEVLRDALP